MPLTRTVNLKGLNKEETNTTNLDPISYNDRYPWLDEYNYKKLESKIDKLWLTGYDREKAMDEAYVQVIPLVQTQIKNSDRRKYINQAKYEASQIENPSARFQANAKLWVTELTQLIKEKYNVDPSTNDEEVFNSWMETIPNWEQLLVNYLNNGDKELLYKWGLEKKIEPQIKSNTDNVVQWWIKGRIADAGSNTEKWDILPKTTELVNPIGYVTEVLDNLWQKAAEKITVGKKAREDLINQINNLSQEDLQQYKERYDKSWYNWSFEDYIIDASKTYWQDLVGADEELKGIAEPNVFKFFGNLPSSTLRLITASFKNATNPFDVAKWLATMVKTPEWREALKNRYLTAEGWANALNYDPMGTADEILSVTNSLWWLAKKVWGWTWVKWIQNVGNTLSNIWSPFDVAVEKALYGGDITTSKNFIEDLKNAEAWFDGTFKEWYTPDIQTTNVKWLYGAMDDIAGDSKVLGAVNRYAQDTSSLNKLVENTVSDVQNLKKKANEWADTIIQNNNRMTKKQQENFKNMIWEDQGKWMNDRNLRTQEDLVNYFLDSKNKVDNAMEAIEWQFTSKQLTDVLDDSLDFAKKTDNPNTNRLQELQQKNANWWLTMSEINEVKRFYEKNNKFNYLKEWTAEKSALATNRDTALREWQQRVAADNWLDNLKELNKETQAAKYLTDNATNWQSGIKGNNPISLTDWIVFAWDGITANSLAWLVSKKVFTSSRFQNKIVDVLNYFGWHETKSPVTPNMEAINQKNQLKANEKLILAEELAKVKNEKEFNDWLAKAEYMAWPALPQYDTQNYNTIIWSDRNPITVTPGWQSVRQGQIAEM